MEKLFYVWIINQIVLEGKAPSSNLKNLLLHCDSSLQLLRFFFI